MAMKCPHCQHAIQEQITSNHLGFQDADTFQVLEWALCPADGCGRVIVWLRAVRTRKVIYPTSLPPRPAAPAEVPASIQSDYDEAAAVLPVSAKASAALSRRCMQAVLRSAGGAKPGRLVDEIKQVLDGGLLPSHVSGNLDYVREVGNLAAHPDKGGTSITDVEPGEAEWNLEVLDDLFDHYYVKPALAAAKRTALETKTGRTLRQ